MTWPRRRPARPSTVRNRRPPCVRTASLTSLCSRSIVAEIRLGLPRCPTCRTGQPCGSVAGRKGDNPCITNDGEEATVAVKGWTW
jgi:hypothetical protein